MRSKSRVGARPYQFSLSYLFIADIMLSQVKSLLRQHKLGTRKELGQHFLVDEQYMDSIVAAAALTSADIVVEVGAGLGMLTKKLAEQAGKVVAVEIDSGFVSVLRRNLSSFSNVDILCGDILKVDLSRFVPDSTAQSYKVVGNLPYCISSPVLRHFLELSSKPSLMVVMVQREVGEAIVAAHGRSSILSTSVQFYSKPTVVTYVPARSFYPPPRVDSVVLRLEVYRELPIQVADISNFFHVVRSGFSSPRKQLRNSLARSLGMSTHNVTLLLEKSGIEPGRRAETLTLREWRNLWSVLYSG